LVWAAAVPLGMQVMAALVVIPQLQVLEVVEAAGQEVF
jgi:hypothetical protein